jgi:pimeloyl-ACP methyl ester carboxylesterase
MTSPISPAYWLSKANFLFLLLAACTAAPAQPSSTATPLPNLPNFAIGEVFDDLAFVSGEDTLVGRLRLPEGDDPFPAIIWIHGSGMSTREEAQNLTAEFIRVGFAVFHYDKRGVGDSEGRYSGVSSGNSERLLAELAADAAAAADFLAARADIDAAHIGLFGASQAGWIIPQVPALTENVHFIGSFSGPTVTVGIENLYSAMTNDQNGGVTLQEIDESSERLADYQFNFGYDPRADIEALEIPALWILGRRDASIPVRETAAILEEIKAEFDKPFTIFIYPNGTHGMVDADTGRFLPFMEQIALPWFYSQAQ